MKGVNGERNFFAISFDWETHVNIYDHYMVAAEAAVVTVTINSV